MLRKRSVLLPAKKCGTPSTNYGTLVFKASTSVVDPQIFNADPDTDSVSDTDPYPRINDKKRQILLVEKILIF
jgi:hypothetical protein